MDQVAHRVEQAICDLVGVYGEAALADCPFDIFHPDGIENFDIRQFFFDALQLYAQLNISFPPTEAFWLFEGTLPPTICPGLVALASPMGLVALVLMLFSICTDLLLQLTVSSVTTASGET